MKQSATRIILLGLCFSILLGVSIVEADSAFTPGTLGYVYEDCKKAAQKDSASAFNQTYCGNFTRGYASGILRSNWIIMEEPDQGSCFQEESENQKSVSNRPFIKIFESAQRKDLYFQPALQVVLASGDALSSEQRSKFFNSRAFLIFDDWASISGQARIPPVSLEKYKDSPLAKKPDKKAKNYVLEIRTSLSEIYTGCKKDLATSENDQDKFNRTSCGAEIEGYLSGTLSNYHFIKEQRQKSQTLPDNACKQDTITFFRNLDLAERECFTPETTSLQVARRFVDLIENSPEYISEDGLPVALNMQQELTYLNTVGYLVMYYDHLCPTSERKVPWPF